MRFRDLFVKSMHAKRFHKNLNTLIFSTRWNRPKTSSILPALLLSGCISVYTFGGYTEESRCDPVDTQAESYLSVKNSLNKVSRMASKLSARVSVAPHGT